MRRIFSSLPVFVVMAVSQVAAATWPERKTRQVDEFTIEYSAGDEAYAEALAARLPPLLSDLAEQPPPKLSVDDLIKRRGHFLRQIGDFLALDKLPADVASAYDGFTSMQAKIFSRMGNVPLRYALWRRAEIIGRLNAGERVAGFELGGETGLNFRFGASYQHITQPDGSARDEIEPEIPWPIDMGRTPGKPIDADIDDELEQMRERLKGVKEVFSRVPVFLVLHEATEAGEISKYIKSPDRRWWCDGVANYIALKIIVREVGFEDARAYYDLDDQLARNAPFAATVNLEQWPAAENLAPNFAEDPNTANYAFATKVIADVCAKHGDDLLPKLFREIGKTPRSRTTMTTVRRAFKKLTGEDLRTYLPKPVAKKR